MSKTFSTVKQVEALAQPARYRDESTPGLYISVTIGKTGISKSYVWRGRVGQNQSEKSVLVLPTRLHYRMPGRPHVRSQLTATRALTLSRRGRRHGRLPGRRSQRPPRTLQHSRLTRGKPSGIPPTISAASTQPVPTCGRLSAGCFRQSAPYPSRRFPPAISRTPSRRRRRAVAWIPPKGSGGRSGRL